MKNISSLEDVSSGFQNGIGKGKKYYGSGTKVANIGDLYEAHTFSPKKYSLLECTEKEIEKYSLKRGDLIFVRSSLKREGVAYCSSYNSDELCLFSSFMIRISCDASQVYGPFLSYQLRSPRGRAELLARSNTSTITNISQDGLKGVKVWLPSMKEQRRIVEILDAAQGLIDQRKEQLALMDQLVQSLFYGMFGEYLLGNRKCGWEKVIDCLSIIDYRGKTPEKSKSGVRLITAKNVRPFVVNRTPEEFIPAKNYEGWMSRGLPENGDVLFTTEAPLGNAAILHFKEPVVIGQRLITLRPDPEKHTASFLVHCLQSKQIQFEINRRSTGSTVKGIRSKEFRQIEIPTPPLTLQTEFAERVKKIEAQKAAMTASFSELEDTFQALVQRAFKGAL